MGLEKRNRAENSRGGLTEYSTPFSSRIYLRANSFEITFSLAPRVLMERREVTFTSFLSRGWRGMKNFHARNAEDAVYSSDPLCLFGKKKENFSRVGIFGNVVGNTLILNKFYMVFFFFFQEEGGFFHVPNSNHRKIARRLASDIKKSNQAASIRVK